MPDATALLPLLEVCRKFGLVAFYDLWREIVLLAGDRAFTTNEICAHADLFENGRFENPRLRAALVGACGEEFGPGKVGKLLARFAGVSVAGIVITQIGREANAVVWSAHPKPERTPQANDGIVVALPPVRTRHAV